MEDKHIERKKEVQREIMSLSTAILAGGIIVGVAVLISANMISNTLGGSKSAAAVLSAQNGGAVPKEPAEIAKRSNAPSRGTGKVVVEEFSDFQCPFCQNFFNTTYKQIKAKYIDTNKITFVYRHFPLSFHQNAQISAEASECANIQGEFWSYHDTLFTNSKSDGTGLTVSDLKKYAVQLGLNVSEFNSCLDEGKMAAVVTSDFSAGQAAGISGTPTFSIDGKLIVGALPFSEFEKEIEAALDN
jgi:protein-disulfide isomerase